MKNPKTTTNKNCTEKNPRCPISETGADMLKQLAESYAKLTEAAARMEAAESCPDFLCSRAWQRAEGVGRVMDNLLNSWENQTCSGLCFDCEWQNLRHALDIIDSLTPCNQWFIPELFNSKKD